ncbi:Hypothetical protein CINCED_3A008781 [Cinara cedri]|uniref:Uncharacterized protein n=1 Tax=Cinara cedri TaxID=506608 RepID=A0A5E4NJR4_9HEMI|nr:Hypothetical protein CINCED_3A008781 [Cinara cedri]
MSNYMEFVVAMVEHGSLNVNGNVDVELSNDTVKKFDYEEAIIDLMNRALSLTGRRPLKRELPNEFTNQVENRIKRQKLEDGVIVTAAAIKTKLSCFFEIVSRAPKRGYSELASSDTISPPKRKKLTPNDIVT